MSKTKEELKILKNEIESLNKKLSELSDDELKEVTGGIMPFITALKNHASATDGNGAIDVEHYSNWEVLPK